MSAAGEPPLQRLARACGGGRSQQSQDPKSCHYVQELFGHEPRAKSFNG